MPALGLLLQRRGYIMGRWALLWHAAGARALALPANQVPGVPMLFLQQNHKGGRAGSHASKHCASNGA
jgi:hypothetical protein